jgi:hypothetical protein
LKSNWRIENPEKQKKQKQNKTKKLINSTVQPRVENGIAI